MQCRRHKLILGNLSTNLKKVNYKNAMIRQWEENWFMMENISYGTDYRKMQHKYLITYTTGLYIFSMMWQLTKYYSKEE